ncbi:MAG: bacteriohemerythrin [Proteobacteria bacterium]|nr:bacteriohemerythrin [Pseudomonadota bacterium]MBU1612749.1 bacteriohemerythrin [Pseudomonadota bacterium]
MNIIEWEPALSIGVDVVDEQHKGLVDMINAAYTLASEESNPMQVNRLLAQMGRYAVLHFSTEEQLMKQAGYAGMEEHKAIHAKFTKQVSDFACDGSQDRPLAVFVFLSTWLKEHIMGMDREYAVEVREMLESKS